MKIVLPEFPTHVNKSKSSYMKVGYNRIYAGINHFVRAKMVSQLHSFISKHIPDGITCEYPAEMHLTIYCPINWGSVRMYKGKISWKKPADNYEPNWDLDNLATLWLKCINDVLVHKGIFPDDTVKYIRKATYEFKECDDLTDRRIVFKLQKSNYSVKKS